VGPRNALNFYNEKSVVMLGFGPLFLGLSARRVLSISTALLEHITQNATLNVV